MSGRRREAAARARRRRRAAGAAVVLAIVLATGWLLLARGAGERASIPAGGEPQTAVAYQWQPDSHPDPDTPLPAFATADPEVERLYRFALARPDLLSYVPCTCGCSAAGHLSNWNCYIRQVGAGGTVVFDDMAPG